MEVTAPAVELERAYEGMVAAMRSRGRIQAMNEAGFWHPLVEFGLAKPDVRSLARRLGLSFHDKPSNACLSSRIAYGEVITLDKLHQVEAAEDAIRALGFRVVRVRAHE